MKNRALAEKKKKNDVQNIKIDENYSFADN